MIIDGHAHVYADQIAGRVIDSFTSFHRMEPTGSLGSGTVSGLLSKMARAGIDYTVMANFAPVKSIRRTNNWTLEVSRLHDRLIPLISVYPGMPVEEIREYFEQGAKGIKMHNSIQEFDPADSGLDAMYHFCEEKRIPVTFHCGETSRVHMNEYSELSHIVPVVKRFPGIPFVLTHLAAGEPETVLKTAAECPNAVFDTSITMTGEHCIFRIHNNIWENDRDTVSLFREIGCHRIAFGSDYPFGNPASDVRRIHSLPLTEGEKEMILGQNSYQLYFPGWAD